MTIAKYAGLLFDKKPKLYFKLARLIEANDQQIEEFIKQIGVNKNDPKIQKIKELKQKKVLLPKDESLIKLLWWQAKQESLQDKLGRFKVEMGKSQESILRKVVEALNKKVLEALQDYNKYPRD